MRSLSAERLLCRLARLPSQVLWPELSLYRFLFVLLQYQLHFPALASLLADELTFALISNVESVPLAPVRRQRDQCGHRQRL